MLPAACHRARLKREWVEGEREEEYGNQRARALASIFLFTLFFSFTHTSTHIHTSTASKTARTHQPLRLCIRAEVRSGVFNSSLEAVLVRIEV